MDIKVERDFQICNDKSVIRYTVMMNKDEIETITDRYRNEYPVKEVSDKILEYIKAQVPDDEEILYCQPGFINGLGDAVFSVETKGKTALKKEAQIKEILRANDFIINDYRITIDAENQSWVKLDPYMKYTRSNMEKIMKLIDAKDYRIVFDGHMEEMYLIYDL